MPLAPLSPPYDTDDRLLLALCCWREARGECFDVQVGVARTVLNRVHAAPAQGFHRSIRENVLKPWAFSSFMEGDPNSVKYPAAFDLSWKSCLAAVDSALTSDADITLGAVFYFSPPLTAPPHVWGNVRHTVDLGRLKFYAI
jgi:spore germination cell wall hydrolase CwlJ-like protein